MPQSSSLLGLAFLALVGCSDAATEPRSDSSGGQHAGGAAGAPVAEHAGAAATFAGAANAGAANNGGATASPESAGASGATTDTAGAANAGAANAGAANAGAANGGASSTLDAPDNATALTAFLDAKQYLGWAKEAAYHQSSGPHGDGVRVFYSPKAAAAVKSGALTLPAGAATVKELSSGGSLYGWAVWVKVQDATDKGNGFYWLEIIHQGGGKSSIYGDALGSTDCVDCHSAGKDYNLSTQPFE